MIGSKSAPPIGSGAKLYEKLLALLMAVALCIGLMPAIAFADEEEPENPTVTLTVIAGGYSDWNTGESVYTTWVNKEYAFVEGASVYDLLEAAVSAGDLEGFDAPESAYGAYLTSITSKDGVEQAAWNKDDGTLSLYWNTMKDGVGLSGSIDAEVLQAGCKYQIVWNSYSGVVAPTGETGWNAYYDANEVTERIPSEDDDVVLTVIAGGYSDWNTGASVYTTWVNKEYAFVEGASVYDLLEAAVSAGDLEGFDAPESAYGAYLTSITSKDGVEQAAWNKDDGTLSLYWNTMKDGVGLSGSIDAEVLQAGCKYQIVWNSYSGVVAPSGDSGWGAYYTDNAPGESDGIAADSSDAKPPVDTNKASKVDDGQIAALIENIANEARGTTDAWYAMELAALGRLSDVEKAALVDKALKEMKSTDSSADGYVTRFQRNIIALTALGVDCTSIPDGSGSYDAVAAMSHVVSGSASVNVKVFTLLAYASGSYQVPSDALLSESALVASALSNQLDDGGFTFYGTVSDPDMTAMAISALAPYSGKYSQVEGSINKALTALKSLQAPDGGFGYGGENSNINSTAMAVVALASAGIDPASSWATEDGSTPLSALLSFATADLKAFTYDGEVDDMATEQGFRALVAYQGLKNTGGAYNIYTQAAKGQAALPEAPAGSTSQPGNTLAQSGDGMMACAGAAGVLALGAICTLVVTRRKMAVAQDARDIVLK